MPVEVEAPQIVVQGVGREKGLIAVALEKGLQAEIVEKQNISQVDLSDVAGALAAQKERREHGAALP